HRQEACKRRVENRTLDPNLEIPCMEYYSLSPSDIAKITYCANHGHNKINKNAQEIVGGTEFSKKVYLPIFKVFHKLNKEFGKILSVGQIEGLTKNLACYLNNNIGVYQSILEGRQIIVNGYDIYDARRNKDYKNFLEAQPQVDNSKITNLLEYRLKYFFNFLITTLPTPAWETVFAGKIKNNKVVMYIALGNYMSLSPIKKTSKRSLNNKKILKSLTNKKDFTKLRRYFTEYYNNPEIYEELIVELWAK
ncbi:MAG: hypothetical protein KDB74_06615, partial [Flavobacteriales bacterium]|nr:hypothetical protein [Flavobacteriales bacterium]